MESFEKLGLFYLGRHVDPETRELTGASLLYESKDLTTHAVCVGMTGSGKTGLCIGLLEEAALDNIPAIIIDPKGDLGNLLLTFPDLRAEDFRPWINPDEAAQQEKSGDDFAAQQAELWRKGLQEWGQDGDRIRRLRAAAEFSIYTPGSTAGIPVSIVQSFAAPPAESRKDPDLLREHIQTTTSGLLELLGIRADPLQSKEHILLSNIIEHAWLAGQDLDLGQLIESIQNPPLQRIGVFDLESFYPAKERFELAMTLNNLLAAPGFKTWMEGTPLDIDRLMYTDDGRPCISIFSIARLSDAERMFFVTLLLNQVMGWMRSRQGTTSLRALLYMDEVFGFFPPVGEPPSKRPLLTLLKQARAYGLGVVLATQNPVDLDYKGLSNAGTWFIGRLQTENDIERLIDGLSGAAGKTDRGKLKSLIAGLKKRMFLLHNVHEKDGPQLFGTRWVLSYLRGPLTREHIKTLMADRKPAPDEAPAEQPRPDNAQGSTQIAPAASHGGPPALPPEIRQFHAPADGDADHVLYRPFLIAAGDVPLFNNTYGIADTREVGHVLPLAEGTPNLTWEAARPIIVSANLLTGTVIENADFAPLPAAITRLSTYNKLDKGYESFIYRTFRLTVWKSPTYKQISRPGESERDFRIRLGQAAHERRDLEIDRLRRRYVKRLNTLERQLNKARAAVERESQQYGQKKLEAAISVGTTLLGSIFGNTRSRTAVSRAAKSAGTLAGEKRDINRAEQKLAEVEGRISALHSQLEGEITTISTRYDPTMERLEQKVIRPKKSDIFQRHYGILWVPFANRGKDCLYPPLAGL